MAKGKNNEIGLAVISIIAFVVVIGLWFYSYSTLKDRTEEDRGTFGDMFGAVNALFSGLAFAGIIITILLQRKELSLQRQELEETRAELKRTADAQDTQIKVLMSQQYQTTFFSLLNAHTNLIGGLNFNNEIGIHGLANFYNELYNSTLAYNDLLKKKHFEKCELTGNNPFYILQKYPHAFYTFFRDLITLVKVIDEKLPDILYYDILFNYLTIYEKYLIGIYCDCFDDDNTKFFINHSYDFRKYYKSQSTVYKLAPENYFPSIKIRRNSINTVFLNSSAFSATIFFDFNMWVILDYYSRVVTLEKANIHIYKYGMNNKINTLHQRTIEAGSAPPAIGSSEDNYEISLAGFVAANILEAENGYYYVDFNFHFKYQGRMFTIGYKSNFSINTNTQGVSDTTYDRIMTFVPD